MGSWGQSVTNAREFQQKVLPQKSLFCLHLFHPSPSSFPQTLPHHTKVSLHLQHPQMLRPNPTPISEVSPAPSGARDSTHTERERKKEKERERPLSCKSQDVKRAEQHPRFPPKHDTNYRPRHLASGVYRNTAGEGRA